jgi:hypothetical protein
LVEGVLGFLKDLSAFSLLGKGGLDLGGTSVGIDGLAFVLGGQEGEFSLG